MMANPTDKISVRPLKADDWPVIEELFGPKGACGGCWCMYWRVEKGGQTWKEMQGEPARVAFRERVESGQVHGVLAFAGGVPVGWCSFGPRDDFPRLVRSRTLQREREVAPWSIICFYILAKWRNQGVATALLAAAAEAAFALGAQELEGYPADGVAGTPLPGAFAWTGVRSLFEKAGFAEVRLERTARSIYVLRPQQSRKP